MISQKLSRGRGCGRRREQARGRSATSGVAQTSQSQCSFDPEHEALGYARLIEDVLAPCCETALGRKKALSDASNPASTLRHARSLQAETLCALRVMSSSSSGLSLAGAHTREAHEAIELASAGGAASPAGLVAALNLNDAAHNAMLSLADAESSGEDINPLRDRVLHLLSDCSDSLRMLRRCVDEENNCVGDNASHRLTDARRRLRRARSRASEAVASSVGAAASSNIDECNGRVVALVHKDNVKSNHLVVSFEAGSQLIAVEPPGATSANNEYQNASHEVVEAEYDARLQLSQAIASVADEMRSNLEGVGRADAIAARARMAESLNMTPPEITSISDNDPEAEVTGLELKGMRHPLLEHQRQMALQRQQQSLKASIRNEDITPPDDVVPVDIHVGGSAGRPCAVITGANAGGKTAALKAAGLVCLMTRAGMYVPARRAHVPLLQPVMVDIQSQQSLSIGLSRFSARIAKANALLENGEPEAIALVDELGAGTSPREGAALGAGLLMELLNSRKAALVLATAHHVGIAALSFVDERFATAAVEFDENQLLPTHKLLWGVPGRSRALQLARRKGLPEHIVRRAEELLPPGRADLERTSKELEQMRSSALKDASEADRLEAENENMDKELQSIRKASSKRRARARAKLAWNIGSEAQRVVTRLKEERQQKKEHSGASSTSHQQVVQPGAVVQLATSGIEATVLQVNNDRSILIKMGSLRVTASLTDIKSIRNGGHESVREDSNESHRQSQQTKSKKRKKKNKAAVKFSQRLQESALQQRNNESEEDDAEAEHSDVHEVRQSEENQQSDQQKRECSQSLADQLQKATGRARPP